MFPLLVTIAGFHLYSLSVALVFAWMVFSFLFWRALRNQGVGEEEIFDLTFYATIFMFIGARIGYVLTHWEIFTNHLLRIAVVWVYPGLSLFGGLLMGLLVLVYLSRRFKVRLGHIMDAFGLAYGYAFIIGAIGSLMDGTYVGLESRLPWAIRYVGHTGLRHPVQLYEIIAMAGILLILFFIGKRAKVHKWPYGLFGLWFFMLYAPVMFGLEFFKDTHVYLAYLRANQWVLVALLAETMGALYVRGGGREAIRPVINKITGGLHGKFSKRST